MNLEIDPTTLNPNKTIALARITDLEDAKQVCVDGQLLIKTMKVIQQLIRNGTEKIYITISPSQHEIIVGGRTIGIAIATTINNNS